MNTELDSLLSNFKTQLNIPSHELDIIGGFFRFLINRNASEDTETIPYGLLIQYDDEQSLDIFVKLLDTSLETLKTNKAYRLLHASEADFNQMSRRLFRHDILLITDCNMNDSLDYMISSFEKSPEVIKIVCAPSSIVENRFCKNDHFFYRILSRHVHLGELRSNEITGQFLNLFHSKGYTTDPEFTDEIAYYIDSIYETADFQNQDFLLDLLRRIELQMEEKEGIYAYRNGLIVDKSFIPYSRLVETLRKQENETVTTVAAIPKTAGPTDAETHIQKHTPSDKDYNILLLALSIFPRTLHKSEFSYTYNSKESTVTGHYQLDPVPHMLDEILYQKGQGTLDKIIMLCTDDTLKKVNEISSPEGMHYDISPVEYFKRQVRNYMRPDTSDEELFTILKVDLNSPYQGIQAVINTLRSVKSEHNKANLNLYLDTHGGIRGIQRILEATVSLLKIENIEVKEAYSVEYGKNCIVSETENMQIFDLVAGVNEFISCGRATTLNAYMERRRENVSSQDQTMLQAIGEVANGIQWCLIPDFQNGLKNLQNFFKAEDQTALHTSNESSYLQIYKDDIKHDYGKLVTKHSVLDEIDWCIRKGFFQQALTLIESKVSNLMIKDWKILAFHPEISFTKRRDGRYDSKKRAKNDSSKPAEILGINDFFNFYIFAFNPDSETSIWLKYNEFNSLTPNSYDNFINIFFKNPSNLRQDIMKVFNRANNNIATKKEYHPAPSIMKEVLKLANIPDQTMLNLVFKIFVLHKILKDVRNNMNHAADKVPYKVEAIQLALEYYQNWLRTLEKTIESRKK